MSEFVEPNVSAVNTTGASPTLVDIMRVFKSLTSRICKQQYGVDKLFQRSYIEHVIRDREDYEARQKYIRDNPIRWYYERLNAGE